MKHIPQEAQRILMERFGKDMLISLATCENSLPSVRTVNAYYEDGAFYVITHGLSNKMKQIAQNPAVGICGDWFTAHGKARNIGHPCANENKELAHKLRKVFSAWYGNGHNDEEDPNLCILQVMLTDGVLFSHGTRFDLQFE